MSEIKYEYQFQDIGYGKISAYLFQKLQPPSAFPNVFRWVALFLTSLFFLKFAEGRIQEPMLLLFGFLGAASLTWVAFVVLTHIKYKRFVYAIEQAPWHKGITKITLSEKGIFTVQESGSSAVNWGFVTDVVTDFPDNVLFLMSSAEFIPCPDASLPSNITRDDLLEQVAKWRAAA